MMERFTKRAREVVERAVSIAIESRASQVRPEHLFAAMLWDDECLAVRVLVAQGADVERLHAELDAARARYVDGLDDEDAAALASIGIDLAEVVRPTRDEPQLQKRSRFGRPSRRFSRPAKKVLELSLREAVALRHNYIGTEHLLLGAGAPGRRRSCATRLRGRRCATPAGCAAPSQEALRRAG